MFCQRETRYSVLDSSDYQVLCVLSRLERLDTLCSVRVLDSSDYQVLCVLSKRD